MVKLAELNETIPEPNQQLNTTTSQEAKPQKSYDAIRKENLIAESSSPLVTDQETIPDIQVSETSTLGDLRGINTVFNSLLSSDYVLKESDSNSNSRTFDSTLVLRGEQLNPGYNYLVMTIVKNDAGFEVILGAREKPDSNPMYDHHYSFPEPTGNASNEYSRLYGEIEKKYNSQNP